MRSWLFEWFFYHCCSLGLCKFVHSVYLKKKRKCIQLFWMLSYDYQTWKRGKSKPVHGRVFEIFTISSSSFGWFANDLAGAAINKTCAVKKFICYVGLMIDFHIEPIRLKRLLCTLTIHIHNLCQSQCPNIISEIHQCATAIDQNHTKIDLMIS